MNALAYEVRQVGPRAYALFKGGRQVSTLSSSLSMIEEKQAAFEARDRKSGWKRRPCITCGELFLSEGSHNRMCNKCRSRASEMFDGAV